MSVPHSLFTLAATAVTGFTLVAGVLLSADLADAGEAKGAARKPTLARKSPHTTTTTQKTPRRAPVTPAPDPEQKSGAACTCPSDSGRPALWPRPKYADLKPQFGVSDEIATLENLQVALSETSDGGTYVWHSRNGWLNGIVQPTTSFKDSNGNVCRHIQVMLTSGTHTSKAEGIACRLPNGQWLLEG